MQPPHLLEWGQFCKAVGEAMQRLRQLITGKSSEKVEAGSTFAAMQRQSFAHISRWISLYRKRQKLHR